MNTTEIVRISKRGQLYIPKSYRKLLGMKEGTKIAISIQGSKAILNVLPEDAIEAGCGFLKGEVRLNDELLKERHDEKEE